MRHKANALSVMVFVLLSVVVFGCQQGGAERVSETNEADGETGAAITNSTRGETTSSEKRGAVARAGDGKAVAKAGDAEARAGNGEARAGNAVAGDGKARAGDVVAGEAEPGNATRDNARGRAGRVKIKVGGQPGTQFSGTCVVGDEERDVSGRVPGRFGFEPDGRKLECEIRKVEPADAALKISVKAGGPQSSDVLRGQGEEVSFSLTDQGTSFSTFSSGSGGSVSQQTRVTSSSSSSVSSSSSSR